MEFHEIDFDVRRAIERRLDRLLDQLEGVDEPSMRNAKLTGAMRDLGPEGSVWLVFELFRRAAWGNYRYKEFFFCFLEMERLIERLGREHMGAMYRTARASSNTLVARLIVTPQEEPAFEEPLHPELQAITLGERRQWAKEFHPRRLELLMKDFDPVVIRHLLNNPKVLERHVLRIITQRPGHPDVLGEVGRHPRWQRRALIRMALTLNPYTPLRITLPLLPLFNLAEIRQVREHTELSLGLHRSIDEIARLKHTEQEAEIAFLRRLDVGHENRH